MEKLDLRNDPYEVNGENDNHADDEFKIIFQNQPVRIKNEERHAEYETHQQR